jgi:hypothetical protein
MSQRVWLILGMALAPLVLVALFWVPIHARCCAEDPDPGTRSGALLWADRGDGLPVLGPDGVERRVPRAGLDRIGHGACLRTVVTVWAPVWGGRGHPILGGLPFPSARVTHRCLMTARDRATGERVRGIIRLVDDPTQVWREQGMLSGPGLPTTVARLERD